MIGQGIPSVVAMQYLVSVDAASAFAEDFYLSLGRKESLAIALSNGQSAMGIEGDRWYRPLLYLGWEDNDGGQLFKDAPVQVLQFCDRLHLQRNHLKINYHRL